MRAFPIGPSRKGENTQAVTSTAARRRSAPSRSTRPRRTPQDATDSAHVRRTPRQQVVPVHSPEERRQELVKLVRQRVEEKKIVIRNLRRDVIDEMKKLEKNKEISQDENKRAQVQLQKITDSAINNAETTGKDKEAELMEV